MRKCIQEKKNYFFYEIIKYKFRKGNAFFIFSNILFVRSLSFVLYLYSKMLLWNCVAKKKEKEKMFKLDINPFPCALRQNKETLNCQLQITNKMIIRFIEREF